MALGKQFKRFDEPERSTFMSVLWDRISGFFAAGFDNVWTAFEGIFFRIRHQVNIDIGKWWDKVGDAGWIRFTDYCKKHEWIDEETRRDFNTLNQIPTPFNFLAYLIIAMGILGSASKQMVYVAGADLRRKLFAKYEPEDAQFRELMPAALIAPEKAKEIRQIMKNTGLGEKQIDLLFIALYRPYDENIIRDLYLRGVLNEDRMFMRMRELGFTDTRIKEMVQGWPLIPGAQDLFHLVAKEAFEPDMIEHYGYADEFPDEQVKWLGMQGISKEWALKYWYAHWETPAIQQGYEMLHRGVIDKKELFDLFRTVEIAPFWRDKLTAIAYMPYTRVDVRRMHKAGVLTVEELLRAYMDVGYDETKAAKMTEFTIAYNAGSVISLTKGQILNGFKEYILTKEEAIELLSLLKFSPDEADFLITFEEYNRDKKLQGDIVKSTKKRFLLSLITSSTARDKLNQLNLSGQKIDILMDSWQLEKYDKEKTPSKSELARFLKNKIINKDQYRVEMYKLNYTDKYIDMFLDEIDKISRDEMYAASQG